MPASYHSSLVELQWFFNNLLEAVQISGHLIAFYSQPLCQPQPYVILLDATSGILKRLDLRATN